MAIESELLSIPITSKYYVILQTGAKGFDQYQGKVGMIRSVRADGFIEVDFSCSGGTHSVHLDSYLMEECAPPTDGEEESLNPHC